jgi:hypothetical protein
MSSIADTCLSLSTLSDLRLVKASVDRSTIEEVKTGKRDFESLVYRGEAFDNMTKVRCCQSVLCVALTMTIML